MKQLDASMNTPGRLTVLAMLVAGLAQTGFAAAALAVPAPNHLVISQVYGGGNNGAASTGIAPFNRDFVEIFNPTSATVNLANWTVQYGSASSTADWSGVVPLTGSIGPGKYYLVQLSGGTTNGVNLPTADASGTGVNISATAGKIGLSKSLTTLNGALPTSTDLIDLVGYGSTANGAEGTAAPAPSGTTTNVNAIIRAGGGCTDTNVNSADFTVGAALPRNSSTAANACVVLPITTSCPANVSLVGGAGGLFALSATGSSSTITSANITGGATAGITLSGFSAASGSGQPGSVNLAISTGVPSGTYPIDVTFGNDAAQTASCTVSVQVAGLVAITHTIPQIQGSGATSPYNGTVQTTEGVVTFMNPSVYVLQDAAGDNDTSTSDAIMIFNAPPAGLAIGDLVRVTGTVTEYQPVANQPSYTEIKTVTAAIVQTHGNVIQPTNVRITDAMDPLHHYQSMLVNIVDTLTIQQTLGLTQYGEISLAVGRKEMPTNRFRPGTPDALQLRAENDANFIVLDDGLGTTPTSIPYLSKETVLRSGDSVTGLTGILDFGALGGGAYGLKVQPTVAPVFSTSNPRTDAPSLPLGNVKVASANVLNFFSVFTNGGDYTGATGKTCTVGATSTAANCRGAGNLLEYTRQRDKIVNELKGIDADVFGLMEIQNDGDVTAQVLVDALNAAIGSTTYAVVPKPASTGTDAIRVAMIYKPSKLTLAGAAQSDGDAVNNRPPFAQTFSVANGGKFSLIVNHLKSKGCAAGSAAGDTDLGDGQSCYNATRIAQATRLATYFIPQVVSAGGTPNVLIIGDLNSYGKEDPIQVLIDNGMKNEIERFIRPLGIPYSYVFDNEAGYLDHALATSALDSQVVGVAEWHNNADEPIITDYNFTGTTPDPVKDQFYVNNAYRASDHDPVIISLALAAPVAPVTDITSSFQTLLGGAVFSRSTGKYTASYSFQNKTGSTITGPFKVQLAGLSSGVTFDGAAGTYNGSPYASVSNASIAPGQTVSLTLVFTNPGKVAINYTPTIYTGNF